MGTQNPLIEQGRQHNGQMKIDKSTNNDLLNITQKTKYRATQNPLETGGEVICFGKGK
jgi:hypothetical protein